MTDYFDGRTTPTDATDPLEGKKEYTDWARKCDAYYEAANPESPGTFCKAHTTLDEYIRLWCGAAPDAGADAGDDGG